MIVRIALLLLTAAIVFACDSSSSSSTVDDSPIENQSTTEDNLSEKEDRKVILFYGNSLTAGYGLDEDQAFPALIQRRIDSLELPYQVVNAGLSGETTAGGLGRIDWVLRQSIDLFVLELGGNDMLRGLDVQQSYDNLEKIIQAVRAKYPSIPIIIAGMQSPPNMGPDYSRAFNGMYQKLADQYDAHLIPFLLEGVGGDPELNLPDGIHPNAKGQYRVRDNVWKILAPLLMEDS